MRNFLFTNVRELLLNVVKHAGTKRAALILSRKDGMVHVQVKDSGRGFEVEALKSASKKEGFGLSNLGERLALLGGRMEVSSESGQGTCIDLAVPLREKEREKKKTSK